MIFKTKFFSGFSLKNEQELFKEYLEENDFIFSGFSYGAQKVFEYALESNNRIDKIQLFSPAFFQDKENKYKRMQLMFFKKNAQEYCDNFLKNVLSPTKKNIDTYFKMGTYSELDELLHYIWKEEKLEQLIQKGTTIEVFLGAEDKIIDSQSAKEFFIPFATVYYIKDAGHIL